MGGINGYDFEILAPMAISYPIGPHLKMDECHIIWLRFYG
jgi:hypothetical protein